MEPAVEVKNLWKAYGKNAVLKGISFEVKPGEIFGLIGPNGAGKTTTLRIVTTLIHPDEGQVSVFGREVRKEASGVRGIISYLPEEAGAYKNLTGEQYLQFMAGIFARHAAERKEFVARAAAVSGLGERLKNKVGTYSKGMTRKLLLARAVMSNPRLAVLDEPTGGLDVKHAFEIRQMIKRLAAAGMTVLVSSHNMLEVEYLCDRVGIIEQGVLYALGTPAELKRAYNARNLEEVFMEVVK